MNTVTTTSVLTSSAFLNIAFPEAINVVARVNSQTVDATWEAFNSGNKAVMQSVAKLLIAAETATIFN
jgi:hypothetical protein